MKTGIKKDGEELYISSLRTLEKYRGFGYGKALFQYIINKFKNKGIESIILSVSTEFEHALQMYKRNDFKIVGDIEDAFPLEDGRVFFTLITT